MVWLYDIISSDFCCQVMTNATNTYDPWGKPGAGAPLPRPEHKKQKFTEYDGFKVGLLLYSVFMKFGSYTVEVSVIQSAVCSDINRRQYNRMTYNMV